MIPMIFVLIGIVSAVVIAIDEYVVGNRQPMRIMNLVWVLTALWGGALALLAYYSFGRKRKQTVAMAMPNSSDGSMEMKMEMEMGAKMEMSHNPRPKWESVALSTLHCGAGCTLADLIGELYILLFPMAILTGWLLEYVLALFIGVVFQYVVIRSMARNISNSEAYTMALRADFWSLTAWQVGMYGLLSIAIWGFGLEPDRISWQFWSLMQLAMICGFICSYPVNLWLIKKGIKQSM